MVLKERSSGDASVGRRGRHRYLRGRHGGAHGGDGSPRKLWGLAATAGSPFAARARTRSRTGATEDHRGASATRARRRHQEIGAANLIFGLHVHVGIPDRHVAIQVMNHGALLPAHTFRALDQLAVWVGRNTGFKSSDQSLRTLPRTGIPDHSNRSANTTTTRSAGEDEVHR